MTFRAFQKVLESFTGCQRSQGSGNIESFKGVLRRSKAFQGIQVVARGFWGVSQDQVHFFMRVLGGFQRRFRWLQKGFKAIQVVISLVNPMSILIRLLEDSQKDIELNTI